MVYSKVEMPQQYMSNGVDGTSLFHGIRGRSLSTRRSTDDTAVIRADLHRRGISQMRINNRSLQDMYIFGDPLRVPIISVERLANITRSVNVDSYLIPLEEKAVRILENGSRMKNKLSGSSQLRDEHVLRVVVFVHGFQGHHLDLRLVRNQWLLIDPKVQFLMSEANEDKTSGDFREMGSRLAEEVISFLKKKMDKASRSGHLKDIKLSFVGHSIGNLIIRTALAESIMEPYLRYLYTYVSMSGPHLGYMYSSNSILNSGLWLLKKIKDIQCIHQLMELKLLSLWMRLTCHSFTTFTTSYAMHSLILFLFLFLPSPFISPSQYIISYQLFKINTLSVVCSVFSVCMCASFHTYAYCVNFPEEIFVCSLLLS